MRRIAGAAWPASEPAEVTGFESRLSLRESLSFRGAKDDDEGGDSPPPNGDAQKHPHLHVRHRWPPRLEPPPHGNWVLMQPWEFGSLPKAWLPMLRRVDEVWAYSRYVRDCYLEAGVPPERVHVVPLGVDPEVYSGRDSAAATSARP